MIYVSERVVNISELEKMIDTALINSQLLNKEIKSNSSSYEKIEELSDLVIGELKRIANFEFCVERRKTITDNRGFTGSYK